jgi:hypothetical protein
MEPKKDVLSPGVRVAEELYRKYESAIRYYGAGHPGYIRACMEAIIEHCDNHDEVILPLGLRVERIFECPHCRRTFLNNKARSIQGREVIENAMGEMHPRAVLPEQAPEMHPTSGEVLFPGMKVPLALAAEVASAIEKLMPDDYTEARREVLKDLVQIAKAGERLKRPVQLVREKKQ